MFPIKNLTDPLCLLGRGRFFSNLYDNKKSLTQTITASKFSIATKEEDNSTFPVSKIAKEYTVANRHVITMPSYYYNDILLIYTSPDVYDCILWLLKKNLL